MLRIAHDQIKATRILRPLLPRARMKRNQILMICFTIQTTGQRQSVYRFIFYSRCSRLNLQQASLAPPDKRNRKKTNSLFCVCYDVVLAHTTRHDQSSALRCLLDHEVDSPPLFLCGPSPPGPPWVPTSVMHCAIAGHNDGQSQREQLARV